jgi:biotin carboxyl carrier protein
MSTQPHSAAETPLPNLEPAAEPLRRMSTGNRILFFVTAWLIVLMPFLFWWNTWFGRQLSETQLTEYLHDEKKPRHIQHALVQIGERMGRQDQAVKVDYPDLVRLASHPVEEVRNTDAWVMGQDTSGPGFHEALLKMLQDSSPMVRGNAALSLVRYGDATGQPQIIALLQAAHVNSPASGRILDADKPGTAIHQGGLVAKLQTQDQSQQTIEIRSPISGRLRSVSVQTGQNVTAGSEIATVDPGTEQVWEALRALYLVGQPEDLPAITPYERDVPENPDHIRQQAALTEKAIRERADSPRPQNVSPN